MEHNPLQLRAKAIILGLKKKKIDKATAKSMFSALTADFFDEIGFDGEGRFDAFTMIMDIIQDHLLYHEDVGDLEEYEERTVIDQFDTVNHGLF